MSSLADLFRRYRSLPVLHSTHQSPPLTCCITFSLCKSRTFVFIMPVWELGVHVQVTKMSKIPTPHSSVTAQPILLKRETYNFCQKTTYHAKWYFDPTTWVVWTNSQFVTVRFLSCILVSSSRAQVAPVDPFWRSIRHMTSFLARMCLLWVLLNICLSPMLNPQKMLQKVSRLILVGFSVLYNTGLLKVYQSMTPGNCSFQDGIQDGRQNLLIITL